MKTTRRFIAVAWASSVLSVHPATTATACQCPPIALYRYVEFSDAVFSGMPFLVRLSLAGEYWVREAVMVRFDCWKGSVADTVHVFTPISPAACGVPFVAGEEYLVFAWRNGQHFSTDSCQTGKLASAQMYVIPYLGPPTNCAVGVNGNTWGAVKQLYK